MFEAQERFGLAVPFLLFAKSAESETAVMPDQGGWAKRDLMSGLLNPPAEIDVITSFVILRIESTDTFKGPAIPSHVTTRNVFGYRIRNQDVTRTARRCRNAGLHPIPRRWGNVWPPYPSIITAQQRADQIVKPVRIRHAVRIGVSENLALSDGSAVVSRMT